MRVIKVGGYDQMSRTAANIIAAQIIMKPDSVLGLATGSSPIGTYKRLIELNKSGDLDFSGITTVNLDEYCGLSGSHDQSYRYFMNTNLFDHINIKKENTHVPDGVAADYDEECRRYDKLIEELGGIDLQLLGIGHNGQQSTIDANSRFFAKKEDVPMQAITMGIKTIMSAKKILLIASGADKKEILERALYGPITPNVPASVLQLHPDLTVVCSVD
jgi:glucosamine-6-phosphate deaminase